MKTRTALLELFKNSSEWRAFFRSYCETSTLRLRSQAWQFCEELADRGHRLRVDEVEDSLLGLARDLLPDTPAAQWDAEWAHDSCKDALAHLARDYAGLSAEEKDTLDLSAQDVWDERMHEAGLANDPVAFRVALDGWTRAGLEAMERLRIKGGADLIDWRRRFEHNQGRTGDPGRQGDSEMERSPAWHPLPCPGSPWGGEEG